MQESFILIICLIKHTQHFYLHNLLKRCKFDLSIATVPKEKKRRNFNCNLVKSVKTIQLIQDGKGRIFFFFKYSISKSRCSHQHSSNNGNIHWSKCRHSTRKKNLQTKKNIFFFHPSEEKQKKVRSKYKKSTFSPVSG